MAQPPNQPAADGASFVRNIVNDPKNVPDVMLLYGYLGASSEENHDRIYLSADLTNYVEVPKSAILHQMVASKEQDPHGGVTLWVKKDAALIYKMAPAAQALAHFFAGAIQAGAAGAGAAPQPTPPLTIGACTLAQALCPPVTVLGQLCTQGNTCGIDCSVVCPTRPPHATCVAQCSHVTPCLVTHIGQPTCAVQCTHVAPCPTHVATCQPHLTCGVDCTVFGPACQTHHATCAQVCTVAAVVCHPTRGEPQCPFPTEATCAAICQASPAPFCGPQITTAACGQSIACVPGGPPEQAAARCFGGTAVATVPIACTPACSIVCQTQQGWVCGSHHTPCCPVQTVFNATCGFICGSQHSLCCPVSGGAFCPPISFACPQGSLACNPGMPGPVGQGQAQAFCFGGTFNGTIAWWCMQTQNPNFCRPHTHNTPCCPM